MRIPATANGIIVLCWHEPESSDANARAIAELLGAEVAVVSAATVREASLKQLIAVSAAVIVSVETLLRLADALKIEARAIGRLLDLAKYALVYGFQPVERHESLARTLSSGALMGVRGPSSRSMTVRVADGHRDWCGQFSGLSFRATAPGRLACFVERSGTASHVALVRVDAQPLLTRLPRGESNLFLLGCGEFADLNEPVPVEESLLRWFSTLVPLMMFLRGVLGTRLWHNDHPLACFIIDDPPLTNTYGFLDYRRLLNATRQQKFSASIAFIPWNYQRSRKETVELFLAEPRALSLSVHGCDHTRGEFQSASVESLRDKALLALDRMQAHRRLTGLPFDEVMVFPQGLFSSEAVEALNASGYLAAVNTHAYPSNMTTPPSLRDRLDVAVTRFSSFPIFVRHYPAELAEFAFDLFLGRPALVVEHHGYFRQGFDTLRTFTAGLNALDDRLEWANLSTVCSHAALLRAAENGERHLRFYTNRFSVTNANGETQEYRLFRQCEPDGPLPSVTINGRHADCRREDQYLTIPLTLNRGQTAQVRLAEREPATVTRAWRQTAGERSRVYIRRAMCEFRDNYVETSGVLNRVVSSARKLRTRRNPRQGALTE